MPWRVCSKTGSRKSRGHSGERRNSRPVPLLVAVLFFFSVGSLFADEITLRRLDSDEQELTLRLVDAPTDRIAYALGEGMRARVDLVLRVLERVEGVAGLLGDRVLHERRISKEAVYDPFAETYIVEGAGGRREAEMGAAIEELLTLRGVEIPTVAEDSDSEIYVMAQARLRPLVLAENLRLLTLAMPKYVVHSSWVRVDEAAGRAGSADDAAPADPANGANGARAAGRAVGEGAPQ